jgi:methylated-DNA-[protein]-cysteine S-methyltransferase
MAKRSFTDRVLDILKRIPRGKVTTYKIIAEKLGTKAYRAVGNVCSKNKKPIVIPCHRVVKSDGSTGGYTGGIRKKIILLKSEGIKIKAGKIVELGKYLF